MIRVAELSREALETSMDSYRSAQSMEPTVPPIQSINVTNRPKEPAPVLKPVAGNQQISDKERIAREILGIGSTTKKSSLVLKNMIDKLYSKEIKFVYSN